MIAAHRVLMVISRGGDVSQSGMLELLLAATLLPSPEPTPLDKDGAPKPAPGSGQDKLLGPHPFQGFALPHRFRLWSEPAIAVAALGLPWTIRWCTGITPPQNKGFMRWASCARQRTLTLNVKKTRTRQQVAWQTRDARKNHV